MGRILYSRSSSSATHEDPAAPENPQHSYPKWSVQNPFDPDSEEFFREAVYEAFLDTNEVVLHDTTSPMAVGPDPAESIAAALARDILASGAHARRRLAESTMPPLHRHPPPLERAASSSSDSSSDSDEIPELDTSPPMSPTSTGTGGRLPTYIYDIPPSQALPTLASIVARHSRQVLERASTSASSTLSDEAEVQEELSLDDDLDDEHEHDQLHDDEDEDSPNHDPQPERAPLSSIRFALPSSSSSSSSDTEDAPSTPPQRTRAIPIPSPRSPNTSVSYSAAYSPFTPGSFTLAYSPSSGASPSPRIYNWSRSRRTSISASPASRFPGPGSARLYDRFA